MILTDSSVVIDYPRRGDPKIAAISQAHGAAVCGVIKARRVMTHPRTRIAWTLVLILAASAAAWLAAGQQRSAEPAATAAGPARVTAFGARGDSQADDTDAVQRAVDQGGAVEFPRGDYRITRTVLIDLAKHGPVSLSGQGGAGRVTMAGAGPTFRFVGTHAGSADPASFKPGVWERERMPQVEGLEVIGAHPDADGI